MQGKGWSWQWGLGLLLAGCPGGEVSPGGVITSGGSSTGGPGITTFNGTVDPTLPGDGSGNGTMDGDSSASGTTMGALDGTTAAPTTSGPGSTTDPTTSGPGSTTDPMTSGPGSTTDPGTTSGSTGVPGTTSGSTGVPGTTSGSTGAPGTTSGSTGVGSTGVGSTGGGCHAVAGNYENCLNMDGTTTTVPCMAPGMATCIIAGGMPPTAGVCSVTDCIDSCDCPDAPPSGNAVVSCDDVTGNPAELFCYLDCGGGETCPTGMDCFAGFLCIWPGAGAGGVPYGDCLNNPGTICGLTGTCLSDNPMAPTVAVCTSDCMNVGDCPAAPVGAMAACQDVTGDGVSECVLDCAGGGACPAGMTCFANICLWN